MTRCTPFLGRFMAGVLIATLGLSAAASAAETGVPADMIVPLGQPSIFIVRKTCDATLSLPARIVVDRQRLANSYAAALDNKQIDPGESEAAYFWREIQDDPAKFLKISTEKTTVTLDDLEFSGTAFAVSREGILLTNAHVVEGVDEGDVCANPEFSLRLMAPVLKDLGHQVGRPVPDALCADAASSLAALLIESGHASVSSKVKKLVVMVKTPLSGTEFELPGVPVKVLAVGGKYPGKDVAVLKLDMGEEKVNLALDTLVCLRLGNSDDVLPGETVQAFGFPGGVFGPEMSVEAQYRVSCQNGQIGQIKPMKIGDFWDVFEMTADINHGDSGGPILNKDGLVIGLNVTKTKISGHTRAVPINVAKAFLKKAGIKPDPGPLTDHWEAGLRLYSAKQYAAAEVEFKTVLKLAAGPFAGIGLGLSSNEDYLLPEYVQIGPNGKPGMFYNSGVAGPHKTGAFESNRFVHEMIFRCEVKLRRHAARR